MPRTHHSWRVLLLTCIVAASGCAVNPVTGERQLALISESQEIEMGRQGAEQVSQSIGLVEDQALQDYIQRLGMQMARTSERPQLPWTFRVVDDPTPNAFAMPGGFIFFTRGLLAMMRSEAELMSVMGHEIGHVTARHSVTLLSRAQLAQIGLGVGSILSPTVARFGDLLGGGLSLLFLQYGRDAERQADDLGFRYMLEQGYDARQMVNVFAALQRSGELAGQSPLPSWLASHPHPEERIVRIQSHLAEIPQSLDQLRVGVADYMARINGQVFGDNPRHGFFTGTRFMHPDMRFRIDFPQGWRTQNLAQAVMAGSAEQDAIIQLTLAQGSHTQAANTFFSAQGITASRVAQQSINGLPAVTGYFQAQTEQGVVAGLATFITHDNRTFQILGYTPGQLLSRYDAAFRATAGSFNVLTDPQALARQPDRIRIVQTPSRMTLTQFNQQFPSAIPIEQIAIINQLEGPAALIPAGYHMKRVEAGMRE
ncbi:M48 family metalloprotease [soil metagenome]